MEIVLVGLNHRTAPVEVREKVSFSAEQARRAADELRSRGILEETLVLSTCNRSELYGVPPEVVEDSAGAVEDFLAAFHNLSPAEVNGCLYRRRGRDAVRHVFRVAAGLDSMLLGEAEILGQVRQAYRTALEQPDIIVCSVGGNDCVLTRPMLERAMAARANRALFIIDLGVPRNVDSAAA